MCAHTERATLQRYSATTGATHGGANFESHTRPHFEADWSGSDAAFTRMACRKGPNCGFCHTQVRQRTQENSMSARTNERGMGKPRPLNSNDNCLHTVTHDRLIFLAVSSILIPEATLIIFDRRDRTMRTRSQGQSPYTRVVWLRMNLTSFGAQMYKTNIWGLRTSAEICSFMAVCCCCWC